MNALALALLVAAQAPAAPAPAPAPPPPPVFRTAELAAQPGATLQVEVPTNVGPITVSLPIHRLDIRGVDGRGRFALELWMNPQHIDSGDAVTDAFIARHVLPIERLRVTSSERLTPSNKEDATPEEKALFGAAVWIDAGNRPRYRQLRYKFTPKGAGGELQVTHQATLEQLGVNTPPHPFVQVTGPVTVKLQLKLGPKA
jgi:hypothetical protein